MIMIMSLVLKMTVMTTGMLLLSIIIMPVLLGLISPQALLQSASPELPVPLPTCLRLPYLMHRAGCSVCSEFVAPSWSVFQARE
ncbi:unnamed protein product [Protopolystoma xenopodis]|uniref:Uncharacterized protein n=1 Tax=Protopolystoma xenopodis TaxID=117903 RepID=A0A448X593_9PLAT|nr:unnamed protein product [Protopolystoma xenopodis]